LKRFGTRHRKIKDDRGFEDNSFVREQAQNRPLRVRAKPVRTKRFDLPIVSADNASHLTNLMAKLVVLSEGLTGKSYELKADRTTIGRVEDNTFHIGEPSVSSHHCEVLLRGGDIVVKDLNSTNGTFINGEPVTESVLKPGQTLRLGQIEMRLEGDAPVGSTKKQLDQTRVIPGGVKLNDLETGQKPVFDKNSPFAKKTNKANMVFIVIGIILGVVIVGFILLALNQLK
jgi:hypothetical protein